MHDPFKIIEPTVISFSGGRTSAYMLWRILQSNNGLPDEAIVCFANTGKEEEATLEFVRDCETNWNVPIHWVEYQYAEKPADRWKKVDFKTASRNGEPFFQLIDQNGSPYLPNPVARICTAQLKIRTIDKYLKSLGWKHNENMDWVGIRADEMRRAAKMDRERTPLVAAGAKSLPWINRICLIQKRRLYRVFVETNGAVKPPLQDVASSGFCGFLRCG